MIEDPSSHQSDLILTASLLSLLAATISLQMGFFGLASLNGYLISDFYQGLIPPEYFESVLFGLVGFAVGTVSCIFSLRGLRLRTFLLGLAIMAALPVALFFHVVVAPYAQTPLFRTMQFSLTIYEIPLIILSGLSSIFAIFGRRKFR